MSVWTYFGIARLRLCYCLEYLGHRDAEPHNAGRLQPFSQSVKRRRREVSTHQAVHLDPVCIRVDVLFVTAAHPGSTTVSSEKRTSVGAGSTIPPCPVWYSNRWAVSTATTC